MGACRWSDQTPSKRTAALCLGVPRPLSEHRVCAHTAPTPRVRTWPCPVDGDPLSQSFPPGNGTDRKGCREIFASFFFFFFFHGSGAWLSSSGSTDANDHCPQMPVTWPCEKYWTFNSSEHSTTELEGIGGRVSFLILHLIRNKHYLTDSGTRKRRLAFQGRRRIWADRGEELLPCRVAGVWGRRVKGSHFTSNLLQLSLPARGGSSPCSRIPVLFSCFKKGKVLF